MEFKNGFTVYIPTFVQGMAIAQSLQGFSGWGLAPSLSHVVDVICIYFYKAKKIRSALAHINRLNEQKI